MVMSDSDLAHLGRTFMEHLQGLTGQTLQVATTCGTVTGVLREVFTEDFLLETPQGGAFVRIPTVCWIRPSRGVG